MQPPRSADDPIAGRRQPEDEDTQTSAMSQQTFDHSTVRDSARAHFGNSYHQNYYGTVHQNAASDTPLASGTPSSKIRDALKFDGMDMRRATIKSPHGSTCQWFFDSSEYQKWRDDTFLEEHHGFLWIRGKPGVGKSTLMRLAVKHADDKFKGDLRISFFFNAKGTLLERSVEGMYRTLLCQLLLQCPQLEEVFHNRSWSHMAWPVGILEEHFRDCVLQLGKRKLICHIDALDECEESDVRSLVEFFEDLGSMAVFAGVQMHVCVASRHYPRVSISKCVHLVLDKLEGHQQDIETYVRNNLKVAELALRDRLAEEIRAKAHDIFLWVVLVVRLLNKESDRGNDHGLRAHLDEIPSDLHDLYESAITERGIDDSRYLLSILLWILFATRPLTPSQLYHAVLYARNDTDGSVVFGHTPDPSQIARFILNTSKGLAEVTVPEEKYGQPRVQFIHETVRKYLQSSGIGRLEKSFCNNPTGMSHDFLKSRCADYISLVAPCLQHFEVSTTSDRNTHKVRRDYIRDKFPFLDYALRLGIVTHAEMAQAHGISQVSFLDTYPLDLVINLNILVNIVYYPSATKTYIFACSDAPQLLQLELGRVKGVGEHQSCVHTDVVTTTNIGAVLNSRQGIQGTPLHAAIERHKFSTIELLLEYGSDVNDRGGLFGTALETAARTHCSLDIFELLFQYGANVTVRDDGETALQIAAAHPSMNLEKFVMVRDAYVRLQGGRKTGSALQTACVWGESEVVKCLVEHGADVNAKGEKDTYGTALQAARLKGHQEVVDYLLEHGARDDNET
jgi:hypothetical protein